MNTHFTPSNKLRSLRTFLTTQRNATQRNATQRNATQRLRFSLIINSGDMEAMSILNFFYGYNYFFDVPDIEAEPCGERKEENLPNISTLYPFNASPNPAGVYSSLSWIPFSMPTGNTVLHIYDVTGVEVQRHEINTKTGQYLLDTSQLVNGLYLIQLHTNGKLLQKKLNVLH